jgi:single-strand DNA-binding protein
MTKGSACFIEGRLKLDTWDDKKTGEKRSKIKVVAESVQFIGGKRDGQAETTADEPAPAAPQRPRPAASDESDPPF